jgi:hypothetical protein
MPWSGWQPCVPMPRTRGSRWSGMMGIRAMLAGESAKDKTRMKERRKNRARLIQKIYEIDPLTCPKCSGKMKVISVIEDEEVIRKILKHLDLWETKERPPPKATGPPKLADYVIDESISQLPVSDNWLYVDPEYPDILPA